MRRLAMAIPTMRGRGIAALRCGFTMPPDLAVDDAFWIAGAECQTRLFTSAGGQPAHRAVWDDDACNALTANFFRNTRQTLKTAWLRPRFDGHMRLQDRAGEIVPACLPAWR